MPHSLRPWSLSADKKSIVDAGGARVLSTEGMRKEDIDLVLEAPNLLEELRRVGGLGAAVSGVYSERGLVVARAEGLAIH